jgi:hypothetical protein
MGGPAFSLGIELLCVKEVSIHQTGEDHSPQHALLEHQAFFAYLKSIHALEISRRGQKQFALPDWHQAMLRFGV